MRRINALFGTIRKRLKSADSSQNKQKERGSSTVEFLFAFLLLFWVMLGFVDVVFQGYNALIINYGSYMGARGYIVDDKDGKHWIEGSETIAKGTMMHKKINAYRSDGKEYLEVTNKEMLKSGIIYGKKRQGTIKIGTALGDKEDPFTGDNAP